ncbi:MAG: T9SS type A sorting domain-containing protein [Bacteroidetes bacterium]|nr:MAG: T9SS type A sorting domain-containing protein [Bacteroidota bacterium]
MKNKSTLSQFLTAASKKTGSVLLLTIFFLPLCGVFSQSSWTQKANFPAVGRIYATGFSIGLKGYIGLGMTTGLNQLKDFWEWDQASNIWTQKADFGAGATYGAAGFSIGTKGYIGTATGASPNTQDLWEWDQAANVWTKRAFHPGAGSIYCVGFSIGAKGYIGTGGYPVANDFWEWDQATDTWTQKTNFGGTAREGAVGFSIGAKGYIGTGYDGTAMTNDFWEWDQPTDTWTQKANFPGAVRWFAVGFSIGAQGYLGTGSDMSDIAMKDFWQWDQATNTWKQEPSYSGGITFAGVGFSIGNYGYIGVGRSSGGKAGTYKNDFGEFCPACPPPCVLTAAVSNAGTVCIGSSASITASGGTNYSWNTGATSATIVISPSVNTTYTVIVSDASGSCSDTAIVTVPVKNCCTASAVFSSDPSGTVCVGAAVYISASGATTYSWSTGTTTANIVVNPSVTTTYSVTVTDASGCTGVSTITIPVDPGCTTTGISQINTDGLQVNIWPNPSDGIFNVEWLSRPIAGQPLTIEVYNVFGEKVYSAEVIPINHEPLTINLSSHPNGIYFLRVSDPSEKLQIGQDGINKQLFISK